ncbi:hypothetical protein A1O7_03009 [Cladophialophora yegresii CBS 114405]|uniref:Uncharacterized protein n=1 Tax=Cladophialophora yegresii CBS 114405 TaxID=1182544 RepID=W9WDD1_9EURO|nr:uncharacterized protein A1O7_03009 [Cladophialophora yegresii CBS 114405]EXJ62571.1 hypothetical protein A1O7_03009 [Cladophialophora yegresii CBS 114405]
MTNPAVSNEDFYKAIIKHAKEKPVVDYDALATEINISVGGAGNKVRAFLKELEGAGAAWASQDGGQATAGAKAPLVAGAKRKRAAQKKVKDKAGGEGAAAAATAAAKIGDDGPASDNSPPRKKPGRASFSDKSPPRIRPARVKDGVKAKNKGKGKEIIVATSDKEPNNEKSARSKAHAKVMQSTPTNNSGVEGEEVSVTTSNLEPARSLLVARGKALAKFMQSTPTNNSGVEGKELSDAPDKKDAKPGKERAAAKPETLPTIPAADSDVNEDALASDENDDASATYEDEDDPATDEDQYSLPSAVNEDDLASEDEDALASDKDEDDLASEDGDVVTSDEDELEGPPWMYELLNAPTPPARFMELHEVLEWYEHIPARPADPWTSDEDSDKDEVDNAKKNEGENTKKDEVENTGKNEAENPKKE